MGVLLFYVWAACGFFAAVFYFSHPAKGAERMIKLHAGDVDVLARTLFGENRSGGVSGMQSVAWVILNRAQRGRPRFADTISGVCRQAKQFSCWNDGDPNAKLCAAVSESDPSYALALYAATSVLAGQVPDMTGGATHYHAASMKAFPSWAHKLTRTVQFKGHIFYIEDDVK